MSGPNAAVQAEVGETWRRLPCLGSGEESVVPDPDEAAGQDVEQKPAQEGRGVEGGESGDVAMGAVLPAEGDLPVLHRDAPIVGESDPIGIAAEVGEDLLGAGDGGLL